MLTIQDVLEMVKSDLGLAFADLSKCDASDGEDLILKINGLAVDLMRSACSLRTLLDEEGRRYERG